MRLFVDRVCLTCGRDFRAEARRLLRENGASYCSRKCQGFAARGENSPSWKGGKRVRPDGYVSMCVSGSPRRPEHVIVAERALGRALPQAARVHHVDGNKAHNAPSNLVICENHQYHSLLHVRTRIVRLGGNPNTEKICCTCQAIKSRASFHLNKSTGDGLERYCRECSLSRRAALRSGTHVPQPAVAIGGQR